MSDESGSVFDKDGAILQNRTEINHYRSTLEARLNRAQIALELAEEGKQDTDIGWKSRLVFKDDDGNYHRMARLDEIEATDEKIRDDMYKLEQTLSKRIAELEGKLEELAGAGGGGGGNSGGPYLPLAGGTMEGGINFVDKNRSVSTTDTPQYKWLDIHNADGDIRLIPNCVDGQSRVVIGSGRLHIDNTHSPFAGLRTIDIDSQSRSIIFKIAADADHSKPEFAVRLLALNVGSSNAQTLRVESYNASTDQWERMMWDEDARHFIAG